MTAVIVFLVALPVLSLGALYLAQDSMVFPGSPPHVENHRLAEQSFPGSETWIQMEDGTRLHGWFIQSVKGGRLPLLIYYGGNAEDVSWFIQDMPRFKGWAVLLMNYRGFGLSEGRPSEQHILDDALYLYDLVAGREDVDPQRIVLMGRSLGTGVAAYVASARPVRGTILVTPYDSITAVGQKAFPWLPVKLLLKHRFEAVRLARDIKAPLLAILAEKDEVIPSENSWNLIKAWGGTAQVAVIRDADHNSITWGQGYWAHIAEFMEAMRDAPQAGAL